MGKYSRPVDGRNSKQAPDLVDSAVCKVCRGRKYILVENRMFNQSSTTVYEKKVCQACNGKGDTLPSDDNSGRTRAGKRALSGTGYLRNNKRRRKKSS
jgi:DnaJ-class molecular chaperone